jgi:hypothetical protein
MGIGMALTMSPMSTAAMNSVDAAKAGVGSGILSMNRMMGGTFGVAAIGALFQHLASDRFKETLAGLPVSAAQREHLVDNLGSASNGESLHGLAPHVAQQVDGAARDAFIHAFSSGMWLSAGVAFSGALIALFLIGPKKTAAQPEAAAVAEATPEVAHAA